MLVLDVNLFLSCLLLTIITKKTHFMQASTEGFLAIIMPRPEAWAKAEASLLSRDQYRFQRGHVT
jgi:hypothetical protein